MTVAEKKDKNEKKLVFAPAIAPMMDAFLEKAAVQEDHWSDITFDNEAKKQVIMTVRRANSRTNAYPQKKTEEATTRSAKSASAYFYTVTLTSILWNNCARVYLIGTDRIWRADASDAGKKIEIDESEMATLRQCMDNALSAESVECNYFTLRGAKSKQDESSGDADDTDEDDDGEEDAAAGEEAPQKRRRVSKNDDDEPSWVVDDDDVDEEADEGDDDEDSVRTSPGADLEAWKALKEAFEASAAVNREIAESIKAQTDLLRKIAESTKAD